MEGQVAGTSAEASPKCFMQRCSQQILWLDAPLDDHICVAAVNGAHQMHACCSGGRSSVVKTPSSRAERDRREKLPKPGGVG